MLSLRRTQTPSEARAGVELSWRLLASKPGRIILSSLLAIGVAIFCFDYFFLENFSSILLSPTVDVTPEVSFRSTRSGNGRLHLLVPATSSNADLCKLLLSAKVLGYPTPVLINYGDHENREDVYVQHLAKVEGILNYLEQIENSEQYAEDLVLILRPDVLIKRFYAINAEADAGAIAVYGEELVERFDIRQKIVFGPDKLCWPVDFSRPACWAVPESALPSTLYGPEVHHEDEAKNGARWLNSGTVIGSAPALNDVFKAALEAIKTNHVTDSDQFYFANLFGEQEYARVSRVPDLLEALKNKTYVDSEDLAKETGDRLEPVFDEQRKTEYHIGIDYSSTMFQTLAFWKQHLAWTRVIDSWLDPSASELGDNPREFGLPDDIKESSPPFEQMKLSAMELQPGWSEVELAYNVLTKRFPVVLHVTGNPNERLFRAWLWQNLWVQSEAERLKSSAQSKGQLEISSELIDGLHWFNAEAGDEDDLVEGKVGAWPDRRGWLSWKRLCESAENDIFRVPGPEYFHPAPIQDTEPEAEPEQ